MAGEATWVRCSDHMPRREGRYIVTYETSGGHRNVFVGDWYHDTGWSGLVGDTTIVAWMEAPEPYETPTGGSDGE